MYMFKLKSGKTNNYAMIEGYSIAGLTLEGINIFIKIDNKRRIKSFFSTQDKINLEGIDCKQYLVEAEKIATDYIKSKNLDMFLTDNDAIIDIVDNDNLSYYSRKLPSIKNVIYLKMNTICSEIILENLETKKIKILVS